MSASTAVSHRVSYSIPGSTRCSANRAFPQFFCWSSFCCFRVLLPTFKHRVRRRRRRKSWINCWLRSLFTPILLLAQITTASTNPQEILDVDNWLAQNRNLTLSQLTAAAQQQGFDPAFIALVGFPQVVEMMAENIDDYAAIGAAVMANQDEVSASIQRLRAQAYASGALRSTPQQQVEVQQYGGQPIYVIQPANPQVVYVPQYNPTVVYAGSGLNPG